MSDQKVNRFAEDQESLPASLWVKVDGNKSYELTGGGLWYLHDEKGTAIPTLITGPFEVMCGFRDFNHASEGLRIEWTNSEGYRHLLTIYRSELMDEDFFRRLADKGFPLLDPVSKPAKAALQTFLYRVNPPIKARIVNKVGWHYNNTVFCLPNHSYGSSLNGEQVIFAGEDCDKYRAAGTLEEWQEKVAIHAKGNSRLAFSLALAFASPLLELLECRGGGFNFFGRSSTGKTTCAYLAGSVWGGPVFYQRWNSTGNALEITAARHNNTLLILDELNATGDPKGLGTLAYNLADGQSKQRLKANADPRAVSTWNLIYLSTGENTLSDIQQSVQKETKSGQEVRLIDIPFSIPSQHGGFEHPSSFPTTYDLARHLEIQSKKTYGTAIGPFLENLVDLTPDQVADMREWKSRWTNHHTPDKANAQIKRVVDLFATVALGGYMASRWEIIPLTAEEVNWGVLECLNSCLKNKSCLGSGEANKAVENIRSYIDKYEFSRFHSDDYGVAVPGTTIIKSGYRKTIWNDDDERVNTHFLFTTGAWKEACGDLNAKEAARSLFELGVLVAKGIDHLCDPITPPKGAGSKARMYVIDRNKLIEADGGIPNIPKPLEVEDAI
jgi:putative DNA primase/helicase